MTDNLGSPAEHPEQQGAPHDTAQAVEAAKLFHQMGAGSLVERMNIEIIEASAQRVIATMPVEGNTQPYGLLHGGASVVLAETVGSVASAMHAGEGRIAVGIDINATHHRAVRSGRVTGIATPLSLGNTLASYEIKIVDEQQRLVCTSRLTCAIRSAAPKAT